MMKKMLIKYLFIISLFVTFIGKVSAVTYYADSAPAGQKEIPIGGTVIGTHLFAASEGYNNLFSGAINAPQVMLGASNSDYSGFTSSDEFIIYGKMMPNFWINTISGGLITAPSTFEITHVNGVCIDEDVCAKEADTSYTITFNVATGNTKNFRVNHKEKIDMADVPASPTETGKRFVCWVDSNEGEGTNNGSDGCFKFDTLITKDYTLKPLFEDIIYTITFDANGGTFTNGTPQSKTCNLTEESCQISEINVSLNGYDFVGWSTVKNESVNAVLRGSINHLLGENSAVTLYAVWVPKTYTISFDVNGGVGSYPPITFTVGDISSTKLLDTPTKVGYDFDRWNVVGGTATISNSNLTIDAVGDIKLQALWNEKVFNITYELAGGTLPGGVSATQSCKLFTETCTLAAAPTKQANNALRTNYIFGGWEDGNGYTYEAGATLQYIDFGNKDVTLTAKWFDASEAIYDITYNLDGGTFGFVEGQVPTNKYTKFDNNIKLATPSKVGYKFAGWNVTGNNANVSGSAASGYTLEVTSLGNVTLNATWTAIKYNIVLHDKDGGQLAVINECEYDDPIQLGTHSSSFEVIEGRKYELVGWTTELGNEYAFYADNIEVINLSSEDGDTVDLYPVLKDITVSYSITYVLNGGTYDDGVTPKYVVTDDDNEITLPTFKDRNGYTFDGWYVQVDGEDKTDLSAETEQYTVTGNTVLVAKWVEVKEYTITYFLDGGKFVDEGYNKFTATSGETITLPEVTREGYKFAGWFKLEQSNLSEEALGESVEVTDNLVLVAKWTPIKPVTKEDTDAIINGQIGTINANAAGAYTVELDGSTFKATINNGQMTVAQTYTLLFQPLFGTIRANADKYTKITHKNGGEIVVKPDALEATEIRDFVKDAFDGFTVMASTRLSELDGKSFEATFHTVDGGEHTYTLTFNLA